MLSDEKHCEILDGNIRDKIATIFASFRLFIQLYSAIVGGTVAIYIQYPNKVPDSAASLSNILTVLVGVVCAVMIIEAQRSWRRFRNDLSTISSNKIPAPRHWFQSSITVIVMLLVMVFAVMLFIYFNPLNGCAKRAAVQCAL